MPETTLYFVTNRRHQGRDRWQPSGYGAEFSRDGAENLRFGRVTLPYDAARVAKHIAEDTGFGTGHGGDLAAYLARQKRHATIEPFREALRKDVADTRQPDKHFGSSRLLADLRDAMRSSCDVLVFVHGFNVSWWDALASAASLELMLGSRAGTGAKPVRVVLFTWPSDGRSIPYWSYFSDRGDAESSGAALGRAFLKLRDSLVEMRRQDRRADEAPCRQSIHLLCHSMGNYVLQNALRRTKAFSVAGKPPRLFDQIFLCAPDVADDVFDPQQPFRRLPETAEQVTIYHNRGDLAMPISDYSKGNTDRLGWRGASRPADLDGRVHQVDCSAIVSGLVEHSYYLCGRVNDDIRRSVDGLAADDAGRSRAAVGHGWPNVWRLT